jgi:GNAT superfamily N-acetyltransferase
MPAGQLLGVKRLRMPRVEVRRLIGGEGPLLRELRLGALRDAQWAFGASLDEELRLTHSDWEARVANVHSATYVVVAKEQAVGLATGLERTGAAPLLVSMWVAPDSRRRGGARLLAAAVESWARQRGHDALELGVVDGNDAADALYRGLGYAPTGTELATGQALFRKAPL